MHFVGLVVSETGEIDEVHNILEPYYESISNEERRDNDYPSKIVWEDCTDILKNHMEKNEVSKSKAIFELLDFGYDYVTPEVLEYKYGIIVNEPQLGVHHEVFNVYDFYTIGGEESRCTPMMCKDGSKKYTAKVKDVYFEYDSNDKVFMKHLEDNYIQYTKDFEENKIHGTKELLFDEFVKLYEHNCPSILINGLNSSKTDYYDDYPDKRTKEQKYNDFIKAIKELNPEFYVTIVDFHC